MGLNLIVLVKQVPDTQNVTGDAMKEDGTVNRAVLPAIFNPEDLHALEAALSVKDANPGLENGLKIGMHLIIPNSMELNENDVDNFIMHTVVKDDTVYNLTKKYEVSQNDLFDLNPSLSEGLKLGMILKIKPIITVDSMSKILF